jgi:hypothetical protein
MTIDPKVPTLLESDKVPDQPTGDSDTALSRRANESILLRSGYALACNEVDGQDVLSVVGRNGQICLRMVLTPEGPVVEMQAQSFRLAASGELRLDCERLELNAREQLTLRSSKLIGIADNDIQLQAGGLIRSEAHAQQHRARLGNIELVANDDVALDGEQIRLNSPKPAGPPTTWSLLTPFPQSPASDGGASVVPPKTEDDDLLAGEHGGSRADGSTLPEG